MLRRDLPLADCPERWLLISQVEHARISGELAREWGNAFIPQVLNPAGNTHPALQAAREEWLVAVHCHDDGWAGLEGDPPIDPVLGHPYSFLDVPREDSLRVWSDSIQLARRHGPLAGWTVAAHFMTLLRESDDADTRRARHWLEGTEREAGEWLAAWKRESSLYDDRIAQEALAGIQAFDWLSLWLCLEAPAVENDKVPSSRRFDQGLFAERPIELVPHQGQQKGEPRTISVSPWPFAVETFSLDALGYAVPIESYGGTGDLVERRIPMRIGWLLVPG